MYIYIHISILYKMYVRFRALKLRTHFPLTILFICCDIFSETMVSVCILNMHHHSHF